MVWVGDLLSLAAALVWAVAVLCWRRAEGMDPRSLNLLKNALAVALLLPTMWLSGQTWQHTRTPSDWALLVLSGVLGLAVADTLFLKGLQRIDASVAGVVDCAYSPSVLLFSVLLLGQPLRPSLLLGAGFVLVGLLFVAWTRRDAARPVDRAGLLLALGGVSTTALGGVIAQGPLQRSPLFEAATVRLLAGLVALSLFELLAGRGAQWRDAFRPKRAWKFAVPGAVLGTYGSLLLWLGGIKYGSAARSSLLNQTAVIFLLILARLSGEQVPRRRWLGGSLALVGVVLVLRS